MSLGELVKLVPPPAAPVFAGPIERRAEIEAELGLTLPQDIVDYALVYGSGGFYRQFAVLNPFDPNYMTWVRDISDLFREMKVINGDEYYPYPIYPNRPGLLRWGTDLDGDQMFWLTEGPSDSWPLILWDRDSGPEESWQRLDMTVTEFLVGIFSNTIQCVLWGPEQQRQLTERREFETNA